ncbi:MULTISPECIES: DUF1707 SHOCT-like domain-containing protein [unclassified Streptomyces]|uniref:DUF1707 SHOCT-like domain-containing protein n=1 Tax=unclassified Streptomyces TaxID=2593676 RepID=UPI00224CA646|nr:MULTISPECIES: DUF1707 domain-containing protein [unclassified Streptomyces]WSP53289.1 DUF1707 domain-containing protein [Streptomyces sp. NBC_01241]WSU26031.1 DUF1707 domain-containing protein [Streptomyces sp. NBC_01108]MCX4792031.1 DUF1707 domain-containing protein [Streptomyces sp. NBC_01221]MCX4799727.1 DUF1707 domain-containing protein [Streptomyces sp. NBC_01242]WSJ40558.1 DUF1707 domain-containing protein [Streptomyces sp. NBC_01321]
MSTDVPELRASHGDRDRVVEVLRIAAGDGRLTSEELEDRVERALTAQTQGELAALVADLPAEALTAEDLVVEQRSGNWSRAGQWTVPQHITVKTQMCRVTLDFTDAVITSRTLRIDVDIKHGRIVIVGAPDIAIDTDQLNLTFSQVKRASKDVVADPRLRIQLVGTLQHAKVVEQRP